MANLIKTKTNFGLDAKFNEMTSAIKRPKLLIDLAWKLC